MRATDLAFFGVGIRVYPGTALERLARRQGRLTAEAGDMLEPVFYVSPDVTPEWLTDRLDRAGRETLNFLTGSAVSLPLMDKALAASAWLGLRPPLWRHALGIRRVLRFLGIHP